MEVEMQRAREREEWKIELRIWNGWYNNSHANTLWRVVEDLHNKGISIGKVRKATEPAEGTEKAERGKTKTAFRRT